MNGGHVVRVLHVVYGLHSGGMEHGVVKLVNGLDRARIQSAICSTVPAGDIRRLLKADVPLYELHRRSGNDPRIVWQLHRVFRHTRPDVVHTHAWGTLLEGLIAARLARVPVVVHGEHGTMQLRWLQRWLQYVGWSNADQVLSVSMRLTERMAREVRFPRTRIRTIHNGVDLARFGACDPRAARDALQLPPEARVIVAIGRLVPVKDHMTLLRALSAARSGGADVCLVLAGDGPLREELVAQAKALRLDPHVRFLGHRADVEVVLAAGDLFVQSSVSEGLSNTILEAMASALPFLATNVGGADEMVVPGETGYLVDAGSADALAGAVLELLRVPGRCRAFGAAGRARVCAEFSLSGMLRQYEGLYCELAAVRRRTPLRPLQRGNVQTPGAL
jgi:L-malate glycosyltransferase